MLTSLAGSAVVVSVTVVAQVDLCNVGDNVPFVVTGVVKFPTANWDCRVCLLLTGAVTLL